MKADRVESLRTLAVASLLAVVAGCADAPPVEVPVVPEVTMAQGRLKGVVAVRDFLREHYAAVRDNRAARVSGPLDALRAACRTLRAGTPETPPSPEWEPSVQALLAALAGVESYAKPDADAFARAVAARQVEDAVSRLEAAMRSASTGTSDEDR